MASESKSKQSRITKKFISDHIDGNSLDLSVCLLLNVPVYELRQFSHLRILDLSQNKLTEISESFATLTFLLELDLSKNSLSYLPCNFGELQQLQKLDLFGNCLTSLPLSFSQLHCLRWLDLRENQLESEIATAAGDCTNEKECKLCAVKVVSLMKCKIAEEEDKQKKLQEKQQVRQKKKDKAEKYQMEQAKRIKHEEKIRRRILWEKNQLLHQVKSTIESEEENKGRPGKFKQYCCSKRLQLFCFLFILIAIATGVLVWIYKENTTVHLKSSPL